MVADEKVYSIEYTDINSNISDSDLCQDGVIIVSDPVTVTVLDTDSTAKEGLNVYAFDNETYTDYHLATNARVRTSYPTVPAR